MLTWSFLAIALMVIVGIISKPWKVPDYVWALGGAVLCLLCGAVTPSGAGSALLDSADVVAFLIGMMLLSEAVADVGLFAFLADRAVIASRGDARLLFGLVYATGVLTTMFLSNDATAVVLTPAVILTARRANVDAVPLVLACAFVSNAASAFLPISNPANLVLYHVHIPPMPTWFATYALPSLAASLVTGALLFAAQRKKLTERVTMPDTPTPATTDIVLAACALLVLVVVLGIASQVGFPLGAATLATAVPIVAVLSRGDGGRPKRCAMAISWGVLGLVPALFIVTEAGRHVGLIDTARTFLLSHDPGAFGAAAYAAGIVLVSALANNLPVGLGVAELMQTHAPVFLGMPLEYARRVAVLAVDIGPNIAITASLATLLWLQILRKEGLVYTPLAFLRLGIWILPAALAAAILVVR